MERDELGIAAMLLEQGVQAAKAIDENIGRLIGASAFLALAGFSLFLPLGSRPGELYFDHGTQAASDVFFFMFDVGIFFSIAFALTALEAGTGDWIKIGKSRSSPRLLIERLEKHVGHERRKNRDYSAAHDAVVEGLLEEAEMQSRIYAEKMVRFHRARGATELAMVSLALLGTARLPDVSQGAKGWLVVTVLALYVFGPVWRVDGNPMRLALYACVSVVAAVLLVGAAAFGGHWWAIGFALAWTAATRISTQDDAIPFGRLFGEKRQDRRSGERIALRDVAAGFALVIGIGVLVYLIFW